MSGWGISDKAADIEKIKAYFNDYIMGLNKCCEINYSVYCDLFDFTLPLIQKAYDLGKEDIVEPSKPIIKLIQEWNEYPTCKKCGSSLKKRFFFFGKCRGCIQPECANYFKKIKEIKE